MTANLGSSLVLMTCGLLAATPVAQPAGAQTPEQVELMLRQRPDLEALLRQQIGQSGLTPSQIRARLRAAGYPPTLLDAYLSDTPQPRSTPSAEMMQAISRLGIAPLPTQEGGADSVVLRLRREALRADSIARGFTSARVSPLTLYGLDVFRQPTTRFQPVVAGPVDDSFILGPGDVLVLILTGAVQVSHELEVTRGGFIVIPNVGRVSVNNLTLRQLRELLYDRLNRVYSGVGRGPNPKTRFDITVANIRVHAIRAIGEVARPGTYQLAATGTVLSALYEAGGLTERGNFRSIEVRRGSQLVATVDLYDYLQRGIVPTEVRLAAGDVIFVPVRGPRVQIAGEVTRPAIYELRPGEDLRDLVKIAGGLNPTAATHTATLDRILPPEQRTDLGNVRTVLTVNLGEVLSLDAAPVPLLAGDSVHVFGIRGGRRNVVSVKGSVWQPGTYQLDPGMRLWNLIIRAGGLRPDTYGGRAQILRTYPDSTRRLIGVPFGAGNPGPAENPPLQELDEVTIFAASDFRPQRYVAVHGAVQRPGSIAFADSMTLLDAVLLAGGLREDAYLVEAEISRLPEDGVGHDSLATVLRVALDSSFVIDETGYVARPISSPTAVEVVLHPYDNVFVRTQPGLEIQRNVLLTGQVRFPGRYTILHKDERLLSVIRRAGGLTPQAYPNGIRFFRRGEHVGSTGLQSLRALVDTSFGTGGTASLVSLPALAEARGIPSQTGGVSERVGIDLPSVLEDASHPDNVVLVAGDSIHIPTFIPTVRVEGAVNAPATVAFRARQGHGYYVDAAGGYSWQANKGGTFVVQPNGLIQKGKRPEPGGVVIVPPKDPTKRGLDLIQVLAALGPLMASVTAMVAILAK